MSTNNPLATPLKTSDKKHLELNSGFLYYIICENERFLQSVMEIIEYCINHHYIKNILIIFSLFIFLGPSIIFVFLFMLLL